MGRHTHPLLVAWLDEQLKANEIAQHAIEQKLPRTLMLEAAKACVGKVMEVGGNNHGQLVGEMQSVIGADVSKQKGDGASWCMSDVQSIVGYAELKTGKQSPLYPSELCSAVWAHTDPQYRVKAVPAPGAICIWGHFNKNKTGLYMSDSGEGHTGIMEQYMGATMITLEGNTTSGSVDGSGKVVRDGGGDYKVIRKTAILDHNVEMQLKGWIIPFPLEA